MPATYLFPTSAQLERLEREIEPVMTLDDPIFQMLPIERKTSAMVIYDVADDLFGLMQGRGYNAEYPSVPNVGRTQRVKKPGVYGEHMPIDELEMTVRAQFSQFSAAPIDISDLTTERQQILQHRHYQRMRWLGWTLISTGQYVAMDALGTVIDSDSFLPQRFTSDVPWATHATAKPLADIRAAQLLSEGTGVDFGPESELWMNRRTFNDMEANTNADDLGGKKEALGSSLTGLAAVNTVLARDGLPQIKIYHEGYRPSKGAWSLWIPDGRFILKGRRRSGAGIGSFLITANAELDGRADFFVKVVDTGAPNGEPPRKIKVFRGFNGGPVLRYQNSVVIGDVAE